MRSRLWPPETEEETLRRFLEYAEDLNVAATAGVRLRKARKQQEEVREMRRPDLASVQNFASELNLDLPISLRGGKIVIDWPQGGEKEYPAAAWAIEELDEYARGEVEDIDLADRIKDLEARVSNVEAENERLLIQVAELEARVDSLEETERWR